MLSILLLPLLLSLLQVSVGQTPDGTLFEGDMVLSKEMINAINEGRDPTAVAGQSRGLSSYKGYKWPGGVVPYVLGSGIVLWKKSAVRRAMAEISEQTCIRFKERTNERDYVEFESRKGGCWSYVGKRGGKQVISLGFGCITRGIAIHEICHALGMWHEQSRPDRDNYVTILWDNIDKDQKHNFRKYTTSSINSLGSPYDYDSIMHYGSRDFAWPPWKKTIVPKRSGASIGQRSHLSIQDTIQLNKFYKCSN